MKVTYEGHAVVTVELEDGTSIIFDPFITGNPFTQLAADEIKVDYILLTHAHEDHVGDTVDIAKRNDATVITTVELAGYLASKGLKTHGMQPGGAYHFDFGEVKMFPAIHGSSLEIDGVPTTLGLATGIMLKTDNKTIYHVGDTALYSDMKLIGERENIALAFVPIGDNYTMGPEDAVLASEWLAAAKVVPIHYNTFPIIPSRSLNKIQRALSKHCLKESVIYLKSVKRFLSKKTIKRRAENSGRLFLPIYLSKEGYRRVD